MLRKMAGVSLVSVWTCVTVALLTVASSTEQSNILYQINATGSAVVLQAIGRLQQSGVFGNDNEILRRIAYVETQDGALTDTLTDGGIWAVSENKFLQTQDLQANIQLSAILQRIENMFRIDWMSVQWRDLRMPLYSMIAARLVLYLAPQAIPPSNDLEAQARFWVQYYNPQGDEADFIGVSSALQGSILDSLESGNEFFLGFSLNYDGNNSLLQLLVTTMESSPVMFTVNTTGFSYSGIATQNLSIIVTLPTSLQVGNANERNKGIYVKAEGDRKLVVYGLNYRSGSTDAFLALPCNHLPINEYEYYAVTYRNSGQRTSAIVIVACEDNTVVNTGQSTSITLNRLQTYLIRSAADLTGRRITANKPIALFSNHECADVSIQSPGACDHLTEQIPPASTWGKSFLAASLFGRTSGELIRIVTAQPPTTITVNCTNGTRPVIYLLTAATNWQEFQLTLESFCSITSTAPILVMQFAGGADSGSHLGDPFTMILPPIEQFSNNNAFDVLPAYVVNYITVYVAPEFFQADRIFIDNTALENSPWSQIYCSGSITCGYITRVNLTTTGDHHRLYHLDQDAQVGVSVYGFNRYNSYGYPGGLKLTPIQLSILSFSSANYQYSQEIGGAQITVTRSGNREIPAVVLVASSTNTSCEGYFYTPVSLLLEFQPGETEKQFTVAISNITRIELYLSAGEGVYLTSFPRAEIVNLDDNMLDVQCCEACVCHGLNCSCQCSTPTTTLVPITTITSTSSKKSSTAPVPTTIIITSTIKEPSTAPVPTTIIITSTIKEPSTAPVPTTIIITSTIKEHSTVPVPTTTVTTTIKSTDAPTSPTGPTFVCTIWCITTLTGVGAVVFTVVGVIIVILTVLKTKKRSSDEMNVEMQRCEAYDDIIVFPNQRVIMEENQIYDEID